MWALSLSHSWTCGASSARCGFFLAYLVHFHIVKHGFRNMIAFAGHDEDSELRRGSRGVKIPNFEEDHEEQKAGKEG